jgi:hypothetical protein
MKLDQRPAYSVFDLLLSHIMVPLQIGKSELLLAEALKTHFGPPRRAPRGAKFLSLLHPIGLNFLRT